MRYSSEPVLNMRISEDEDITSLKRLHCRNRSDTSNLQIYFDLAFVLNSLFITRQQLHRITSNALTTEYLMKPAGIINTMLFIINLIYIYIEIECE